MAGEVDFLFESIAGSQALVDAGKLPGIAVTGRERSPVLPNIPMRAGDGELRQRSLARQVPGVSQCPSENLVPSARDSTWLCRQAHCRDRWLQQSPCRWGNRWPSGADTTIRVG
jgi:hypothetical protein